MTWTEAALAELCEINVGRTPARANPAYWGTGEPWLSIADMNHGPVVTNTKEQITRLAAGAGRRVQPGTVLLSFKLSIGKVAMAGIPLYTNEAIAALPVRDTGRLDPAYLMRVLEAMNLTEGANRAAMGATLNKRSLADIRIAFPEISEQRRIAAILDEVDAVRARRLRVLAHLDSLPQSLLFEMFDLRRCTMRPVAEVCDRVTVGVVVRPASHYVREGVPALRTLNVKPGRIELDNLVHFSHEANDGPLAKSRLRAGDLVVARTGKAGVAAVVPGELDGANAIDLIVVSPDRRTVDPVFLECLLNSDLGKRIVSGEARGQIQQHFNVGSLKKAMIPVPPVDQQREFAARVRAVGTERAAVRRTMAADDELLASLRFRAFRGEL